MKFRCVILLLSCSIAATSHAETIQDPCAGISELLNLLNRPTYSDSACTVPFGKAVVEMGYQYLTLRDGGHARNLPNTQLRVGLPADNEIALYFPNHNRQTAFPHSGSDPTFITFKHEIGYSAKWYGALEAIATLPNGSAYFGSKNYSSTFNAIIDYKFTNQLQFSLSLAYSSNSQPSALGGKRYSSINQNYVFSWQPKDYYYLYLEIFGTSHTDANKGPGYNGDAGIVYLIRKNISLDVELGQRINGNLIGFKHYVGVGLGFEV